MGTAIIAGAFIGAMVSGAVHGIRGGSGNGAFLAMLGGAAAGAAGGYAGGALGGTVGSQVGSALGSTVGSTGIPISTLISGGARVIAGAMQPDYPKRYILPNSTASQEALKKQGISSDAEYYNAVINQNSATQRALEKVNQGTGENGTITIGDLMQAVDPSGLYPTEGEMTIERWEAIKPIYAEAVFDKYRGTRSLGAAREISEAKEGLSLGEKQGQQYTKSGIPLEVDPETGLYTAVQPFAHKNPAYAAMEKLAENPGQFGFPESGAENVDYLAELDADPGGNVLPGDESPSEDYYYTSPQTETDSQLSSNSRGDINTARQTARYNSFAAARASEDALRAQSLLSTSKSLNLPRFDEENGLASNRFTQKPKPFV